MGILRDISKQDTVEYMLAMVDEMLTGEAPNFVLSKTSIFLLSDCMRNRL